MLVYSLIGFMNLVESYYVEIRNSLEMIVSYLNPNLMIASKNINI